MISVLPAKHDLHITQRHPLLIARRWQVADPGGTRRGERLIAGRRRIGLLER
ncbi:MAG: hypothetical protein AB7G88_03350 [Thermomicrobiales bacterium]